MARPKRDAKRTKAESSPPKKKGKGKAPAKPPVIRNAGVRKQPTRLVRDKATQYRLGLHMAQFDSNSEQAEDNFTGLPESGPSAQPGTRAGGKEKDKAPGEQLNDELDNASFGSSENSSFWARTLASDEPEEPIPLPSRSRQNAYWTVRPGLESLKGQIKRFANEFYMFKTAASGRNLLVKGMIQKMSPELRRYVGCIAHGKAKGVEGWMNILCTSTTRRVLLAGIIGRVLVEHVFMSLYFGADEDQMEVIRLAELDSLMNSNDDAILRAKKRAQLIEVYEWQEPRPPHFQKACADLTLKLQTLLDPLLEANPAYKDNKKQSINCTRSLLMIVRNAAEIARSIRADGTALYHFKHIIKGDKFDPKHQEAINLQGVLRNKTELDSDVTDSRRLWLTCMIVLFPECIMYRPGRDDDASGGVLDEVALEDHATPIGLPKISKQKGKGKVRFDQKKTRIIGEQDQDQDEAQQGKIGNTAKQENMGSGYRSRLVDKGDVLVGWSNESTVSRAQKGKDKTMAHEEETYVEFENLVEEDIPMTWLDRGKESCAPQ